jgi:hypothetical protein
VIRISASAAMSTPIVLCILGGIIGSAMMAGAAGPADLPSNPGVPFAYAVAALLFILPNLFAAAAANHAASGTLAPFAATFLIAFLAGLAVELVGLDRAVGIDWSALADPVGIALIVANCAILLLIALRRGRKAHG